MNLHLDKILGILTELGKDAFILVEILVKLAPLLKQEEPPTNPPKLAVADAEDAILAHLRMAAALIKQKAT